MDQVLQALCEQKAIPMAVIDDEKDALLLARTLSKSGFRCLEIAFRTPCAAAAIHSIHEAMPDLILGAGSLHSASAIIQAVDAGASFLVSAGIEKETASFAIHQNVTVIPGVCTPSEIETALSLGLSCLKFFPAELSGGVKMLRTLSGPYPDVFFMPSGGINDTNCMAYLEEDNVFAVSGSWLCERKLIQNHQFAEIGRHALAVRKLIG